MVRVHGFRTPLFSMHPFILHKTKPLYIIYFIPPFMLTKEDIKKLELILKEKEEQKELRTKALELKKKINNSFWYRLGKKFKGDKL